MIYLKKIMSNFNVSFGRIGIFVVTIFFILILYYGLKSKSTLQIDSKIMFVPLNSPYSPWPKLDIRQKGLEVSYYYIYFIIYILPF